MRKGGVFESYRKGPEIVGRSVRVVTEVPGVLDRSLEERSEEKVV